MSVTLKCAACGAEVEFEALSPAMEEICPGCAVKVRYREGDEQMAIPVSMNLPEEFTHVNLAAVADKSSLLVGRYKKQAAELTGVGTDVVLANALETLANTIGRLEERLGKHERGGVNEDGSEESTAEPAQGNGDANDGTEGSSNRGDAGERGVVQLEPEGDEAEPKFRGKSKANPVGAQVLVRREAAKEAHKFRREKHTQADWDDQAQPDHQNGFAWLMGHYPKTTVFVTLLFAVSLITATIMWMDDMFTNKPPVANDLRSPLLGMELGKLMADDPEAAMAETVARAYLNATSVKAASPFIYESEAIQEKFKRYYQALSAPGNYDLNLKHRALGSDGEAQFLYRVTVPGEKARMLVVLLEGVMPKVYWEFFAEVGDLSWDGFLKSEPREPVEMRVWAYPESHYGNGYLETEWQSYILHDYAENKKIIAYAPRGAGEDWRILDSLKNEPVQFNRHSAVMALVKLAYMAKIPTSEGDERVIAEIKEVVATSWLPERFRSKKSQKER
jgi:hypothetical protein